MVGILTERMRGNIILMRSFGKFNLRKYRSNKILVLREGGFFFLFPAWLPMFSGFFCGKIDKQTFQTL